MPGVETKPREDIMSLGFKAPEPHKPKEVGPEEIKYVVWDLNGTLRDTIRRHAIHSALVTFNYFGRFGLTRSDGYKRYMRNAGCSPRDFVEDIGSDFWFARGDEIVEKAVVELDQRWDKEKGTPLWEAYGVLKSLHDNNIKMAMASNAKEKDIRSAISFGTQGYGEKDYIECFGDAIAGTDSVEGQVLEKGEPQLRFLAEKLRIDYDELIQFGTGIVDTARDVRKLVKTGMRVVGFSDIASTRLQLLEAGAWPVFNDITHFRSWVDAVNLHTDLRSLPSPVSNP